MEKVALPWYEEISYKGLKIDGKWQATINYGKQITFHEDFNISQKGHRLTGAYSIKNEYSDGTSRFSTYNLEGRIINNHVTFTCFIKSQREIGLTTFILQITDGGDTLEGRSLWINRTGGEIECYDAYQISRV